MTRAIKWAAIVATLAALATVFAPALWRVSHAQALTNVLVGEFATLTMGYTAYRIAYGKDPSRSAALVAAVLGAIIAASPLVFGLVQVFTSVNMIGGGIVVLVGLVAFATTFTGSEDRSIPDVASGRDASDEQAKAA